MAPVLRVSPAVAVLDYQPVQIPASVTTRTQAKLPAAPLVEEVPLAEADHPADPVASAYLLASLTAGTASPAPFPAADPV